MGYVTPGVLVLVLRFSNAPDHFSCPMPRKEKDAEKSKKLMGYGFRHDNWGGRSGSQKREIAYNPVDGGYPDEERADPVKLINKTFQKKISEGAILRQDGF